MDTKPENTEKPVGRPPKPDSERRDNVLRIRLTEDERAQLDEVADNVSTWAREVLLRAARRARG